MGLQIHRLLQKSPAREGIFQGFLHDFVEIHAGFRYYRARSPCLVFQEAYSRTSRLEDSQLVRISDKRSECLCRHDHLCQSEKRGCSGQTDTNCHPVWHRWDPGSTTSPCSRCNTGSRSKAGPSHHPDIWSRTGRGWPWPWGRWRGGPPRRGLRSKSVGFFEGFDLQNDANGNGSGRFFGNGWRHGQR